MLKNRRAVLKGLGLSPLLAGAASGRVSAGDGVTIYSPAPPTHPMHALNLDLEAAVVRLGHGPAIRTIAMALPDSVNWIADLAAHQRPYHLPIVTTVDFGIARRGAGPSWHRYGRAHPDLMFVSRLYDAGFGVFTSRDIIRAYPDLRGCRIGVPPRPSAVRLLTEALLRDAWNILDHVTLVEMTPAEAATALTEGRIEATTWNLVLPGCDGDRPVLGDQGHFLGIDSTDLARLNAANGLDLTLSRFEGVDVPLISFAQALAAWSDTPPEVVSNLVSAIEASAGRAPGLPDAASRMLDWPGLSVDQIHPAATPFGQT